MPSNTKDINFETTVLKAFVLGKFGTGKSVFASSFPTPGYVFDFDNRISSYRGADWDYDTFPMTAAGWVSFEKTIKVVEKEVTEGKYKTVVVDSTTAMNDTAMERAMQIDPKRSDEGGPLWNVHYMIVKNILGPKIRRILSWPCNIVFCGHWNIKTDPKNGNILSIDPILTGDLSDKIPGYFDEVYAADSGKKDGKDVFFVRTTSWGHYRARSTISGKLQLLPAKIPNDYAAVIHYAKRANELEKIFKEQGKEAFEKARGVVKEETD
jgi:hypothetical protein